MWCREAMLKAACAVSWLFTRGQHSTLQSVVITAQLGDVSYRSCVCQEQAGGEVTESFARIREKSRPGGLVGSMA